MKEKLAECSFLIPMVRDSDRKPHPIETWWAFQEELRTAWPEGHTGPEWAYRDVRPISGEYRDSGTGRVVRDVSRRFTLAVPESRVGALRSILADAARRFDQKAIYLSVAGVVEFVVPAGVGFHWPEQGGIL